MSIKLIAFDLDGVLVDDPGSWAMVHKGLGTLEIARRHEQEFSKGLINYDQWAQRDALLWKGADIRKVERILSDVPLMKGIHETLPYLQKKYKLAILSGGLKLLADRVMDLFGMDYVVANDLIVEDGLIKGIKQSMAFNDKGRILRDTAVRFNIKASECAAVGDYLNDIPMFETAGLSVAFNPKSDEVSKRANYVIHQKDLKRLLEIF
ncbi:MAG: HAD family phosphatase [Candidatus Altiarchaeota archaeon]|nr:HAD family phosphatase [Candidatus Altiarchaeota archaeon]